MPRQFPPALPRAAAMRLAVVRPFRLAVRILRLYISHIRSTNSTIRPLQKKKKKKNAQTGASHASGNEWRRGLLSRSAAF